MHHFLPVKRIKRKRETNIIEQYLTPLWLNSYNQEQSFIPVKRLLQKAGGSRGNKHVLKVVNVGKEIQHTTAVLCFVCMSRKGIYYLGNRWTFMFLPPLFPFAKTLNMLRYCLCNFPRMDLATVRCWGVICVQIGWAKQLYSLWFNFTTAPQQQLYSSVFPPHHVGLSRSTFLSGGLQTSVHLLSLFCCFRSSLNSLIIMG